ncbi:hypothetical protein [Paludisphaera rhizosphaerae]|uniref:hypothetical protein n=1 Tax=Paludisphaera rhizosphaerae TaxID=2711216 RepID=UPI0013ECC869|nr:hypothetical protein [Paludisphaera rhizosphaerae]
MENLDLEELELDGGVLVESSGGDGRAVLWIPLEGDAGFQYWDRVAAAHRSEVRARGGLRWTAATATRARRRTSGGALGRLVGRLTGRGADAGLVMPDGGTAERCGERRADLALVWSVDGEALNEDRLRGLWPDAVTFRRLGGRLALASGVGLATPDDVDEAEDSTALAGRMLESARAAGDRRAEAAALADLGMLWAKDGRSEAALGPLHEALALRRTLGDHGGEADVLVDLGRVLETLGRARESRGALDAAAALAAGLDDAFARKAVLERLADALVRRGDPAGAASVLGRAREAARAADDRRHEARVLWLQAAAWAEAGRPDLALARANESTALLRSIGSAEADWYEAQLRRYRSDASTSALKTGPIDVAVATSPAAAPTRVTGDLGIFRMALSATRAMATFLGSGMRTTTAEERRRRLETCRACAHHTGLRCRICGCFTKGKSAMPDERCPIGRW